MLASLNEWFENPKAKKGAIAAVVIFVIALLSYSWFSSGQGVRLSSAPAMGTTKASISGTVTDFQGKPVPNLALKISWQHPDLTDKKPFSAITDAQGKFLVADMVNGQFSITPANKAWIGGTVVVVEANQEIAVTMKVRRKS